MKRHTFVRWLAAGACAAGALQPLAATAQNWPTRPIRVIVPFAAGGLLSMGRITSTLFPVFLASAAGLTAGGALGLTVLFALLQGLLAALFYTWRDVY